MIGVVVERNNSYTILYCRVHNDRHWWVENGCWGFNPKTGRISPKSDPEEKKIFEPENIIVVLNDMGDMMDYNIACEEIEKVYLERLNE